LEKFTKISNIPADLVNYIYY